MPLDIYAALGALVRAEASRDAEHRTATQPVEEPEPHHAERAPHATEEPGQPGRNAAG